MTWAEFKAAVEAAGVKDDTPIFAIDIVPGAFLRNIVVIPGKDGSVHILEA